MPNFTDHIPRQLIALPNVSAFAKVLDGMLQHEMEQVAVMEHTFDPRLNKNPHFIRKFLYEAGKFPWLSFMQDKHTELAILKAVDIWGQKGSTPGLQLFLSVFESALLASDFTGWWPRAVFIPGHPKYGVFPNAAALVTAKDDPREYPFLFAGTFSYYYNSITIEMTCGLMTTADRRKEFAAVLPLFLAMCSAGSCNLVIQFYDNANHANLIDTLNI